MSAADGTSHLQGSYDTALEQARAQLRRADLQEVRRRSGAQGNGQRLVLPYLGARCEVLLPEARFQPELPLVEKILVLHYLLGAGQAPTRGELVAFKNLPGAAFYEGPYRKRGPERIAARFAADVRRLPEAARPLGGSPAELGDVSVRIPVLPKIEAVVVLYAADEELPAEASILFSDTIVNFLPLEDVAVLSGVIASRLGKAAA